MSSNAPAGRELLVLGMLRRQPLSAYAVAKTVQNHSPLYRHLGHGNLYHFIDRLAEEGYVTRRSAKAKRGPAVTKSVFRLSATGEKRLTQLLNDVVCDPQADESSLEVAFVLLGQMPRAQAVTLLRRRDECLASQERRVKRLFGDMNARSGPAFLAGTHALARLASERKFLRDALRRMINLRWHPEWLLEDGAAIDPSRKI